MKAIGGHLPYAANCGFFPWKKSQIEGFGCQVEKMTSLRRGTFFAWFAHSVKERYLKSFGVSHYQLSLDWISFLYG